MEKPKPLDDKRSKIMRSVKGANTAPEKLVRSILHRMGFRFRVLYKALPGRPDIVLPKWKTAIFIHGCFWHRHEKCKYASMPKHNSAYWTKKFEDNVQRDKRIQNEIHLMGWRCIVIWECQLRNDPNKVIQAITRDIVRNV